MFRILEEQGGDRCSCDYKCLDADADSCVSPKGEVMVNGQTYIDAKTPCVTIMCRSGRLEEFVRDCPARPVCKENEILKKVPSNTGCCDKYECEDKPEECEKEDVCEPCGEGRTRAPPSCRRLHTD